MPATQARAVAAPAAAGSLDATLVLAWLAVGVPLAWGFTQTIMKASALFR
jgi:hypothetical protein